MNKDKKPDTLSFIKQMHGRKTAIKDIIKDKLSFIEPFTWTLTWTKCPSSPSRQNFANLVRYDLRFIDIIIDMVSMIRGVFITNPPNMDIHMDIMSMIKSHARTNAWTKPPCSKYYKTRCYKTTHN